MNDFNNRLKSAAVWIAERAGWLTLVRDDIVNSFLASSLTKKQRPLGSAHNGPNYNTKNLNSKLDRIPMSYAFIKRTFDLVISLLLLPLLMPVFLFIAILIKIDSPGPVFIISQRVGMNESHFKRIKFRTMVVSPVVNLPKEPGTRKDPRITRIGHYLRKTSLDKLPQLFNVLRGDMSLVGPRPLPLRIAKKYKDNRYMRRFWVKPGIIGVEQIDTHTTSTCDAWIEKDLAYIDHWSLRLDLEILAKKASRIIRST
jgi:lipopolysaccharide/colanic/teichoic acid biosynthesis glycosyltransferase